MIASVRMRSCRELGIVVVVFVCRRVERRARHTKTAITD
jgi:hypothetical protein